MPRFRALLPTLFLAVLLAACDEVPDLSLPNEPPQANDDDVELLQDVITNIEIGFNDIDVDGNVEMIELISDPANGTAEVTGSSVRYIPDRLFTGTDSFDYRITDTKGESDEARVSITVKLRQNRALFGAVIDGIQRLYMLDSRDPGSLMELSESLDATESVRDWAYDAAQQEAVMLTDADRIVIAPLSDPATVESFTIDLGQGETVDGGFDISALARRAAVSINHRIVRTFNLDDGTVEDVDTGWTDSTMEILFFSPVGTSVIMAGTLGDPAMTALYVVPTAGTAPTALFEDADTTGTIGARALPALNDMVWLVEQAGATGIGPFTCQSPPEQRLSSLFYVSLLNIANTVENLNAASGLLTDPTDIISYNLAEAGRRVFVAACPPGADIVQLIEIPFPDPSLASVVATGNDPSDGIYDVNVANNGLSLIYAVSGDNGLRPIRVDLSDPAVDPVITDLSSAVPQFQTYADGMAMRAPASALSSDRRRWVFVAPDGGEPTLLTWLELDDEQTTASTTLPFQTTLAPVSDGYLAFVIADRPAPPDADDVADDREVALVRLDGTPATAVMLPGLLTRSDDALATAPVVFAPVALADSP